MKEKPKIALIGYGRMGMELHRTIEERGWPAPLIVDPMTEPGYESIDDLIGRGAQVCIEFTTPGQAARNIISCVQSGLPVVSGTTGWEEDREAVQRAVEKAQGACIHANNFSIGVYLFRRIATFAASLLDGFPAYDYALHEIHHTGKIDAPSGTALTLAAQMLAGSHRKSSLETTLPNGAVDPASLYVTSTRVGSVIGEHRLLIDSEADGMEISHHAKGRRGFAEGALLAAQWIYDKKGMYTLEDMIDDITED